LTASAIAITVASRRLVGEDEDGAMIRMPRGAAAVAVLALASGAGAQVTPSVDMLEGQIIHWVGPQVRVLQDKAYEQYVAAHKRDMVMPFQPVKTGACRMTKAVLVIRRDGTGEFDATTMTLAANAKLTWHTNILLLDGNGRALFGTGDFVGPEMNDGKASTPYVWVNRFTMDQATMRKVYDEIDHASLSYRC
jgi:hypothetical protein